MRRKQRARRERAKYPVKSASQALELAKPQGCHTRKRRYASNDRDYSSGYAYHVWRHKEDDILFDTPRRRIIHRIHIPNNGDSKSDRSTSEEKEVRKSISQRESNIDSHRDRINRFNSSRETKEVKSTTSVE
jgi:hypothetical protein